MGDSFGYSILDVKQDSIFLYDKRLGQHPQLMFSYPINTTFYAIESTDTMKYQLPSNVKIDLVLRDNASIFTRIGIDNENIYTGNSLGYVKATDKNTGKLKWEYQTGASLFSRPAVTPNAIIVPTTDRRLLWLDKETGKLLHEHLADGPLDGQVRSGAGKGPEVRSCLGRRPCPSSCQGSSRSRPRRRAFPRAF